MNSFRQVMAAIYVALAEAAGGPAALRRANQVLRDAIADGAVDDPTAIMLLESLAHDEDDEDDENDENEATITPREFRWLETI